VYLFGFWLLEIPLGYWLAIPVQLRSNGVFVAIVIAETAIAGASAVLFKRGRWKRQQI
jgi:Na+-driven multidrug efflux pump